MPEAKPFAGRNALETVVFLVQFRDGFSSQDVEALFSLKDRLATELPSFEKTTTHTFGVVGNGAPLQQAHESGVVLQRFTANGRADWVLRASGNQVVVVCSDYSKWVDVEAKAMRLMYSAVQSVRHEANPIQVVMMQFVDKFVYEGVPADYSLDDVFRSDSPFLTAFSKTAGLQWHVFQGWFADNGETKPLGTGQALNVLNIASSIQPDGNLTTTIDHTTQFTVGAGDALLFTTADKLNTHFAFLHNQNKYILRNVLSDKQLEVIGLGK